MGARQVEVIDGQAVSLWHCAHCAIIDLHGAASEAIVLLQPRVLREEWSALLRRRLRANIVNSAKDFTHGMLLPTLCTPDSVLKQLGQAIPMSRKTPHSVHDG